MKNTRSYWFKHSDGRTVSRLTTKVPLSRWEKQSYRESGMELITYKEFVKLRRKISRGLK